MRCVRPGAAGVVAGQIIDASGALLDCSYNRRVISADLASLRAIPKRLVVVQEVSKFEPLLAGLAGGLCTHLVVSAAMAQAPSRPRKGQRCARHHRAGRPRRRPVIRPSRHSCFKPSIEQPDKAT